MRNFILLFLIGLSINIFSHLSNAETLDFQSEFTTCLREKFFNQENGCSDSVFSDLQSKSRLNIRNCKMSIMHNIDLGSMTLSEFTDKLNSAQVLALEALNKDLNKKFYECGYIGNIEIGENSGKVKGLKFEMNTESCTKLKNKIDSNTSEISTANQDRKIELLNENNILQDVFSKSNCEKK